MSPYLHNVYTDNFSATLRDTGIGYHIHDGCINSLSYADDMALLVLTAAALQDLHVLNFVDIFTYFGHFLHRDMTDDADIRKQTTKLTVTGNILLCKFSNCSLEMKLELLRSHCYSLYCNLLWSKFKVVIMNRLRICHNDVLKRLLGLPRWTSSSLRFTGNKVNEKCGYDSSTLRVQHEE